MESAKSTFIEKIAFALLPITFSCIVYLISVLNDANHRITLLESKIQVAVSSDNKMIINPAPLPSVLAAGIHCVAQKK